MTSTLELRQAAVLQQAKEGITKLYDFAWDVHEGEWGGPGDRRDKVIAIGDAALSALSAVLEKQDSSHLAAPTEAIGSMLNECMDRAVANGANSVSMPDEYVAVAAWLAGITHSHLPACDSAARSGSGVPARPTIPGEDAPIDMVLYCPVCGLQHVDAPEPETEGMPWSWDNPPHKSHLCHRCGHIWRPADVPTNGVLETKTRGAKDSFTSMLGTPKTAATFDEFFDREYPNVEDRQGRFRNSNGYQLCWRGWEAATERAAAICRGVNNHDNPLTANDCADEIEKGLEP